MNDVDVLAALWRFTGYLGAAVVIAFLAYTLYCIINAIIKQIHKGGKEDGRP